MKGVVLTLDAIIALLIAVSIISLLVFFRTETVSPFFESEQLHSLSEDALTILSESTLREVTNQTLLNYYLTPPNQILNQSDLDKKAIDVIGALWVANRSEAANISKDILGNILPTNVGYQVLINGNNVYNSSDTPRPAYGNATAEISSNRIASGYEFNKSTSGFVARAWATNVKRTVTTIIPVNEEWGGFSSGYCSNGCWANGYAPASERGRSAILIKNFTLPSDATIFSAYLQLALDNGFTQVFINGNSVFSQSNPSNTPYEINITRYVTPGLNQYKMIFNSTINTGGDALAHFHPGTYMKIKYNTSQVDSGSNVTVFNADWIQGAPAAIATIPFFVNAQIRNVTAYVDVQNINAFLLVTLNYKWNASNPLQNVLLYRNYPVPINCSQFSSQTSCQNYSSQCFWNTTVPVNNTIFNDGFEVDISTNWTVSGGTWTRASDQHHSGSYSGKKASSSPAGNLTSKAVNTSNATAIYISFWYRNQNLAAGDVYLYYNDSSGNWDQIADLSGSQSSWYNNVTKITDSQYFHSGFAVRFGGKAFSSSKNFWIDDLNITKTVNGNCQNLTIEDVKNRTYEIDLNSTGSLIKEYNSSSGNILNTWFNTNVTLNNIQNNMTNILGIYADIRAPTNYTIDSSDTIGGMDWQRLGMYANDNSTNTTLHPNDHYCFITDKTNVTVYHDLEQYGLEYGRVDITSVQNFTDALVCCESKQGKNCASPTCKDDTLNLSFPFATSIIESRVIGTEDLGGNDNGYNWLWMWNYTSPTNETNIVLDTDTPSGTLTYLPVRYFQLGRNNTVRVGDKDPGRYLDTDPTAMIGNKRSVVEYKFLIPAQVGYGDVFNTSTVASNDAVNRLTSILSSYATSADIQTENYTVSNVPYMWGPANIKISVWI